MKKNLLFAAAAAIALTAGTVTASAAPAPGWYGTIEAGVNWAADEDGVNDTIDTAAWGSGWTHTAQWDTGWAILGSVGYGFGNWRAELELGYRNNDLDSFGSTGGVSTDGGDVSHFTVMANALYDFTVHENYGVSLGAGVGLDNIDYDNSSGWHTVPIKDSDTVFAWQLIFGVSRPISSLGADLVLNYRYLQTSDVSFRELDSGSGDLHNDEYDDLSNHTVTLGLRWR